MQEAPTGSTTHPLRCAPAVLLPAAVLLTVALLLVRPGAAPAQTPVGSAHHPACDAPAFHTFDFWPGEWTVESRFRTEEGWHETTQRWSAEKRVGGCILVDYAEGDFAPVPLGGMGTRYYDPTADHWVITWFSTRAPGRVGRWTGDFDEEGVGEFVSEGDGDLRSRIRWTEVSRQGAHWEYAVSRDGGETWRTLWIMDFRRETDPAGPNS